MIAGLLLAAAAASPLFVERVTPADIRTVSVRVSDLDLARADHRARLQRRLNMAVNRACPVERRNLRAQVESNACRASGRQFATRAFDQAVASNDRRATARAANDVRISIPGQN